MIRKVCVDMRFAMVFKLFYAVYVASPLFSAKSTRVTIYILGMEIMLFLSRMRKSGSQYADCILQKNNRSSPEFWFNLLKALVLIVRANILKKITTVRIEVSILGVFFL